MEALHVVMTMTLLRPSKGSKCGWPKSNVLLSKNTQMMQLTEMVLTVLK